MRLEREKGREKLRTYHFQLAFGDPADAVGPEVGVPCLDAAQAAEVLVALLLPLGDQVLVGVSLLDAVLIELCQKADVISTSSSQEVFLKTARGISSSAHELLELRRDQLSLRPPSLHHPSLGAPPGRHLTRGRHLSFSPLLMAFLL